MLSPMIAPTLAINGEEIAMAALLSGSAIAIISILSGVFRSTRRTREIEQSRREIAAYVAEGSITPDDAVRMMNSNPTKKVECSE